jgi:hypothetical protein
MKNPLGGVFILRTSFFVVSVLKSFFMCWVVFSVRFCG